MSPFQNGNYVLSLLWWGSPIKISCPVTPVISQPTPSVLCSQFGMVIAIEGAREAAEKHRVKGKLNQVSHFNLLLKHK